MVTIVTEFRDDEMTNQQLVVGEEALKECFEEYIDKNGCQQNSSFFIDIVLECGQGGSPVNVFKYVDDVDEVNHPLALYVMVV